MYLPSDSGHIEGQHAEIPSSLNQFQLGDAIVGIPLFSE